MRAHFTRHRPGRWAAVGSNRHQLAHTVGFHVGASASADGKSIIACHSTAARGTASRIVAKLDVPVTTPRNDTQIVVTEHGWVNLRGLTVDQRARALIGLAAPQFRDGLEAEARAMGLIST